MSLKKNENAPKEMDGQPWKGFSVFLHVLLPIAGLALLYGHRGIFTKLLLQLDRNCIAVYCPSFSKRQKLLKWASGRLPSTWSSHSRTLSSGIPELWRDGSLLCTLINSAVPEACPNPHRHWRKPPMHAQALAYKYLGLVPMFTDDELSGELNVQQEQLFIKYLQKLQEAINNWQNSDESNRKISSQYVARGMGLCSGELNRKSVFYLYSNETTKRTDSSILIYIRGPYGTVGKATVCSFHTLQQNGVAPTKHNRNSFLKTISFDLGTLMNNSELKSDNEIPIEVEMESDRAKVTYIAPKNGIYEINLICEGEILRGSPFLVRVVSSISPTNSSATFDFNNVNQNEVQCKKKNEPKIETKYSLVNIVEKIQRNEDEVEPLKKPQEPKQIQNQIYYVSQVDITVEDLKNEIEEKQKPTVDFVIPQNPEEDENNNFPQTKYTTTIDNIKIESSCSTPVDTSPICFNHIVPEVETSTFNQLNFNEKRKFLSKQSTVSLESEPQLVQHKNASFSELSVLNVLQSLKQTRTEMYPLSSTVSLPDISSANIFYGHIDEDTFKVRRDYWERLSSRSSSNASLANSESSKRKFEKKIKVVNSSCNSKEHLSSKEEDSVFMETEENSSVKSLDTSLEDCIIISLKERKEQLFKNMQQALIQENQPSLKGKTENFNKNAAKIKSEKHPSLEEISKNSTKFTIKSQFKKAISFFKSLEENSQSKEKNNLRRFSLDSGNKKKKPKVKGGSLNLSNVSERFLIQNLYADVFGSKNSSFKGTPNNVNMAKSLASISKDSNVESEEMYDDSTISYNLFASKPKSKKRKSIQSVFEIHY